MSMPDHAAVLARHPLPWRLSDDFDMVLDANGEIVISDGTGAFVAFEEPVGHFVVDAVNEWEDDHGR